MIFRNRFSDNQRKDDNAPAVLHLRHPQGAPLRSVTVNGRAWNEFDAGREIVVLKGLAGAVRVRVRY